ncbi:MAG: ethanolamine ammonia-lyase light chain EutC, partial [Terriglobales bacterium]
MDDFAPHNPDHLEPAGTTPARLSVSRSGTRPKTKTWLAFRQDHARARDAVASALSDQF